MDLNKKCFITKDVLVNKKKIKFMYHEQPDNESDSGWRFFSGDETQEYVDDSNNLIFISFQQFRFRFYSIRFIIHKHKLAVLLKNAI